MRNGIFPTKKALLLFLIPLGLFIISLFFNFFKYFAFGANIVIFLIIFLDGFLSPDIRKKLIVSIQIPKHLKINSYNDIVVRIKNNNRLGVKFYLLLDFDYSFDRQYSKKMLRVLPLHEKEITLKIFAKKRGDFKSDLFFIKAKSLFGLLFFYRRYKHSVSFNVVPYVKSMNEHFKILQRKIKKIEGIQKNKQIGDGNDFEMLREYTKDDEFNKIDWKATSRVKKAITRVYRMENTLELAIMIDCGRLMTADVKGMSLLDYAVNSALVLSYSAVKGNDKVSLTCFGSDIVKYIPPIKNKKDIKKINYILTEIEYQHVESNYQVAFSFIKQKLPKRSLIIILTDIIDDSNVKIYHKYFSILKKKHIVLLVLVRDKNLFRIGESMLSENVSLFTKTAAADLILRRKKTIHELRKLGIDILDLYPEEISSKIINKYIEIKNRY